MSIYDAPNQQVVRADGSGPWEEGTGGVAGDVATAEPDEAATAEPDTAATTSELDAMTKSELLAYAQQLGVSPANNDMTKDELRTGVDAKLAGG